MPLSEIKPASVITAAELERRCASYVSDEPDEITVTVEGILLMTPLSYQIT